MLYIFIFFTLTFQYNNPLKKFLSKTTGFYITDVIRLVIVKSYLNYRVDWLETWHRLDWERIFFLGEILLETTVITDFMCPSVSRDRLFVLLFLQGKIIIHIRMCCRILQSFLTQNT
jgi:hypothetical protein